MNFRRVLFAALLALFAATPALSRELRVTRPASDPGAAWIFIESTGAVDDFSEAIDVCPTTTITMDQSLSAAVSVYETIPDTDTLAEIEARTRVAQFSADQAVPFVLNGASNQIRIVVDTKETVAPATYLRVLCNKSANGASALSQANPSTSVDADRTTAFVTSPAPVKFGWGVSTEGTPPAFDADRYPGGPDGRENNNMMGVFYNKEGVLGSTIPNRFEWSFDCSWELGYRSTPNTQDQTWIEENCDYVPPDFSTTMSGTTGSFVAGDVISFSGGGSARVLTATGVNPNVAITFRHDFASTAQGEVVTNITRAGSGSLGTLTPIGVAFRPYISVYRTLENVASFEWDTFAGDGVTTFGVTSGYPRKDGRIMVAGTSATTHGPAFWGISNAGTISNGTELCASSLVALTCTDVIEFSIPATPTNSDCSAERLNGELFIAMCR